MIPFFTFVVVVVGVGHAPQHTNTTTTPAPTVALFYDEAGFAKARFDRVSITVGVAPEFEDGQTVQDRVDWLDPVLDAWNMAAGWELFVQVTDDAVADVTFDTQAETKCSPDAGACAFADDFEPGYNEGGAFAHCYLEFFPWFPPADTAAHELGHCLGFVDVPVGEQVEGGYAGIMTHMRPWGMSPDNEFDRASLAEVGYRVEASTMVAS